jgi:hypothetical protein
VLAVEQLTKLKIDLSLYVDDKLESPREIASLSSIHAGSGSSGSEIHIFVQRSGRLVPRITFMGK